MKESEEIHVYCMPGMAANPSIFEYINLPKPYVIHWLSWKIPEKEEPMQHYVKRMLTEIKHPNPVLIGVSFGGIIVQEMSKYISIKRILIISSVKTTNELPQRMRFAQKTGLYKVLPTSLAKHITKLEKLPVTDFAKKRLKMYKQYMSVSDKQYLDWAIRQVVCWQQKTPLQGLIHIHGDKDVIFPIKNIKNCIVVKGGTHVMIINRFRWFNENLPVLISKGKCVD